MVATHPAEQQAVPLLKDFYLTFGVQYSHEPHPYWTGANPNGWVQIHTKDNDTARRLARRYFGQRWSMLYDELYFNPVESKRQYYPLGCIALITDDGAVSTITGVEPPAIHISSSDPEFHGVDPDAVIGVRIEGHLYENPSEFYDVMVVHHDCMDQAYTRFKAVIEEDLRVRAFELDWDQPAHCDVCETSLT